MVMRNKRIILVFTISFVFSLNMLGIQRILFLLVKIMYMKGNEEQSKFKEVPIVEEENKEETNSPKNKKSSFKMVEKVDVFQRERIKSVLPIKEAKKLDKEVKYVRIEYLKKESFIKSSENFIRNFEQEEKKENWKILNQSKVKPFPLWNYAYCIETEVNKFGVETKNLFIFGGQSKLKKFKILAKYKKVNLLYQSEITNLSNKISWKNIFPNNTPSARINHSMTTVYKNHTYIFGGETAGLMTSYSFDFYKLNTKDYTFTQLKPGPPARSNHTSEIFNGKVYIFGGTDGKKFYSDLWEYNIENDQWGKVYIDYKPSPRLGHQMIVSDFDNGIYIIGGYRGEGKEKTPLKEIWRFDGEWNQIDINDTSLLPFKNSSCICIGNKFLMFGGDIFSEKPKINELFLISDDRIISTGDISIDTDTSDNFHLIFLNDKLLLIGNEGNNYTLQIEGSKVGDILLNGGLFGSSLKTIMERFDHQGLKIPYIVDFCLKILMEEKAYEIEGILRKSGKYSDIIYLKLIFENGMKLDEKRFRDPHSVAVVLKKFLSSLNEPIVTETLSKEFLSLSVSDNPVEKAQILVKELPDVNYFLCQKLFYFLSLIWENRKVTLMEESNLGIILGTSLLGNCQCSDSLLILLKYYQNIFKEKRE